MHASAMKTAFLLMLCGMFFVADASGNSTVYIIRHGEKTWALGCLNGQGKARAANLVSVFNGKPSPKHPTFQVPKYIFANWYHDPIDCERCNQTVTPTASALGLTIDLTHGGGQPGTGPNGGNKGAAAAIVQELKATGGPVLVAWEHMNIQYLTEDLGVAKSSIPAWSGSDYDTIYVLEFDETQQLVNFQTSHENFTGSAGNVIV